MTNGLQVDRSSPARRGRCARVGAAGLLAAALLGAGCGNPSQPQQNGTGCDQSPITLADSVVVFSPHPDDEVLGFGGVIYAAVVKGKYVQVVLATDGDNFDSACSFWIHGCMPGVGGCTGSGPTPAQRDAYGQARRQESMAALSLLGVAQDHVLALGYPDGHLQAMYTNPSAVEQGNGERQLSHTGKPFTGTSFAADVDSILNRFHTVTVFTTAGDDGHPDHAYLHSFVHAALRKRPDAAAGTTRLYETYIHPRGTDGEHWPPPAQDWTCEIGNMVQPREARYRPDLVMELQPGAPSCPITFTLNPSLLQSSNGQPSILRRAIDCYQTQIGNVRLGGGAVDPGFEDYLDCRGFLLAFARKTQNYWRAQL